MYEERRWGRYRVLDYIKYPNGNEVLTKRICVLEGKNLSYQYHLSRSEVWTVISGHGEMVLDGNVRMIAKGMLSSSRLKQGIVYARSRILKSLKYKQVAN